MFIMKQIYMPYKRENTFLTVGGFSGAAGSSQIKTKTKHHDSRKMLFCFVHVFSSVFLLLLLLSWCQHTGRGLVSRGSISAGMTSTNIIAVELH